MARKNKLEPTSKTGVYTSINGRGEKEFFGKVKINYTLKQVNLTKRFKVHSLKEAVGKLEVWRDNLINGYSENYNSFNKKLDNYYTEHFYNLKKISEQSNKMLAFYNRYISKEIGHLEVDKIENKDIQKIIYKLERLGELSVRSITKVQQCLRPCFNQLIKEKVIIHNPATYLDFEEKLDNSRNLDFILKSDLLETLQHILDKVEEIENKQYKLMFYISIYCVRRLNEVLSIEWEDVDLKEQYILIHKENSKNKLTSKFYIVDKIALLMRDIREDNPFDKFVFQSKVKRKDNKTPYFTQSIMRRVHRNILIELEKEGNIQFYPKMKYSTEEETILNLKIHDYRHFFGNIFRPICQDLLMIKSILSHSDKDITTRYSQYTYKTVKKGLIDYYNLLNGIK